MAVVIAPALVHGQTSLIVRADSAWAEGDRSLAQRLYREALTRDAGLSHAVFRLAQLEGDGRQSLVLYERYTRLEPTDAWGHMARGDALARLARYPEALAAYDRAAELAPGERDVALGRARVLERAGRPESATTVLDHWLVTHGGDAEAWDLLGREALRRGRPRAALDAFARADSLGRGHGIGERIALARSQRAATIEPIAGSQGDSDNDRTLRLGVVADVAVMDGVRVGFIGQRHRTEDAFDAVTGLDLGVRVMARPKSTMQLQLQTAMSHFDGAANGVGAWSAVTGEARFRVRLPLNGPALDLRAQRTPLGTSPLLIANRAIRNEARATIELPLGALRLSGSGRAGNVETIGEPANSRLGGDATLALPLGSRVRLSGQYHRFGYSRSSSAGYFAPSLVETREGAMYVEAGDEGVSFAADLGAGVQRVMQHGSAPGAWARALRGWSYLSIPLARGHSLWMEAEAYDAPFAPDGVSTSASWRFLSVSIGARMTVP